MILITGGSGLLGKHLALVLCSQGERVRLFDFRPPDFQIEGAEFTAGDIRDPAALKAALADVETVYHLAALMHVGRRDPFTARSVNIGGLKNLMNCTAGTKVSRIVFASTIEIYGTRPSCPCFEDSPKNPPPGYPSHKWRSEIMLADFSHRSGVEVVFPRMPMILGAGFYHFKSVLLFFEALNRGLPIVVLDGGERKGRMAAVEDVVAGLMLCAERPGISGEAFNLCADDVFTHRSLIEGVIKRTGSSSRIVASVPSRLVRPVFDLLYGTGMISVAREHFYFSLSDCDYRIDKAKEILGYEPRKDTVTAMVDTYRSYIQGGRRELRKELSNNMLSGRGG